MNGQPPVRSLRLVFQGSIPIKTDVQGDIEYKDLKVHLSAVSPDFILNGQIIKVLEPCCNKKASTQNAQKNSIPTQR